MNEDKSTRYHRLKRRIIVVSVLINVAVLAMLTAGGASVLLRNVASAVAGAGATAPSTVTVYALFLSAALQISEFPLVLYGSFIVERRYGLSSEPLSAWLADHAKAAGLVTAFGLAAAHVIYWSIRWWPQGWWIVSALTAACAAGVLTKIAPTILMPIFCRFTPLERVSLQERLLALSRRARVPILGVYVWGLGAKSRKANAALVGTGSTRRILVSDTLLDEYSDEEIEVILAHEIGHHVHRDIRTGLIVEAAVLTAAFGAAALALSAMWQRLGLESPADVAGAPLLLAAGGLVSLGVTPLLNGLSRRNEQRADQYALALTSRPSAFVSAMRRLATQNLAEERPSRSALWLFHTHPSLEERLQAARRYELALDAEQPAP